jgi:uncharacterized membrane protein YdbT with pleckstrin-like domain
VAFPRKLLTQGEEILLETNPHWKAIVKYVLLLVLIVVAVVAVTVAAPAFALAALAVGGLFVLIGPLPGYLRWHATLFVLTNERVIRRTGVLGKHSKEIPLDAINDVSFNQSFFDRMLGSGRLALESAGEQGQEVFTNVRKPEEMQKRIYEASEGRKGHGAPAPALSAADEIAKLADLKDRGVLSEAEFEDRKRKLLS